MTLLFSIFLSATLATDKAPSPELNQWIQEYHQQIDFPSPLEESFGPRMEIRAFAEYEDAKYLLTSTSNRFGSDKIKEILAKNLPEELSLILLAENLIEAQNAHKLYSQWLPTDRFKVFIIDGGAGFWSRDSLPVPSLDKEGKLHLTDARYYHYIEPDKEMLKILEAQLSSHRFYFEGGNILADRAGNCFVVENSRVLGIPDEIFHRLYGCNKLYRFPHEGGIGHIDERLKILADNVALTDNPSYQLELESLGYEVDLLPKPQNPYENYANALVIHGRAFVPSFGQATDDEAFGIYEKHGLEVVPVPSSQLSNRGKGSVHCITMLYPHAELKDLAKSIGAQELYRP